MPERVRATKWLISHPQHIHKPFWNLVSTTQRTVRGWIHPVGLQTNFSWLGNSWTDSMMLNKNWEKRTCLELWYTIGLRTHRRMRLVWRGRDLHLLCCHSLKISCCLSIVWVLSTEHGVNHPTRHHGSYCFRARSMLPEMLFMLSPRACRTCLICGIHHMFSDINPFCFLGNATSSWSWIGSMIM